MRFFQFVIFGVYGVIIGCIWAESTKLYTTDDQAYEILKDNQIKEVVLEGVKFEYTPIFELCKTFTGLEIDKEVSGSVCNLTKQVIKEQL